MRENQDRSELMGEEDEQPPSPKADSSVDTETHLCESSAGRVSTWFGSGIFSWFREIFTLQYTPDPESYYRICNKLHVLDPYEGFEKY